LFIQARVLTGEIELAWSYILDFENSANPFPEKKDGVWMKQRFPMKPPMKDQ